MTIFYNQLEKIINAYVALDPYTAVLRQALVGKTFCLQMREFPVKIYLEFTEHHIHVVKNLDQVDVTIKGSLSGFTMMSLLNNKNAAFASGGVEIIGETEVAHQFHQFWQSMHIDWEEHLSQWLGDPIAHWLGKGARLLQRVTQHTRETITNNLTEYLQEEIRYLPPREEVADFMNDVDVLRSDLERIEARIKRLL
jgi:ubiquinone biosynthesis protein UbiJ